MNKIKYLPYDMTLIYKVNPPKIDQRQKTASQLRINTLSLSLISHIFAHLIYYSICTYLKLSLPGRALQGMAAGSDGNTICYLQGMWCAPFLLYSSILIQWWCHRPAVAILFAIKGCGVLRSCCTLFNFDTMMMPPATVVLQRSSDSNRWVKLSMPMV